MHRLACERLQIEATVSVAPPLHANGGVLTGPLIAPRNAPMSEYEFTISLRIRHPTIDPAMITTTLGIQPQHTWRVGQPRCDPAGAEVGGVHHDSYWMGRLMDEPQLSSDRVSVERVILTTLSQLRGSQSFLEQMNAEGAVAAL